MNDVLVRLEGITRRFGAVIALAGADLELRAGEVHGVLGENGAGKTTLLNVLGGLVKPDAGSVTLDGNVVSLTNPRDAWALGVGLVHQHFKLVPRLSVLENLTLGRRAHAGRWRLPLAEVRAEAMGLVAETGLSVPLVEQVESLGVGDRQRVEILKALLRRPRIVVLDEPTAVLAPPEVEGLFALLRRLAAEGRAVVIVAHKLDEVLSVADRVTVLHEGHTVLTAPRADVDAKRLASAMVGTESATVRGTLRDGTGSPTQASTASRDLGPVVAACLDARVTGPRGDVALDGVSLEVRRGEIVGIAGVEGNGQRELALLFAGRASATNGACELPARVGFVPQDRTDEGLILDFDLAENVALLAHRISSERVMDWPAIRASAERIRLDFDIRALDTRVRARTLSGGNQQRLVVGREMGTATDLLVVENPTRGLDVASAEFVHRLLQERVASADPPGVLLISTDLDEVLALSHRVFAIVRGKLIEIRAEGRTREAVGLVMLSGSAV